MITAATAATFFLLVVWVYASLWFLDGRARAAERLHQARVCLLRGNVDATFRHLWASFCIPASGHWSEEALEHGLACLHTLEQTLERLGARAEPLTWKLRGELRQALEAGGGWVKPAHVRPVTAFLRAAPTFTGPAPELVARFSPQRPERPRPSELFCALPRRLAARRTVAMRRPAVARRDVARTR